MVKQTVQAVKVLETAPTPLSIDTVVKPSKVTRVKKMKEETVMPVVNTAAPVSIPPSPAPVLVASELPSPVAPADSTSVDSATGKSKSKGKSRNYDELFAQVRSDIDTAYKHLQSAFRLINSLESAHNRAVSVNKVRETPKRTPTIMFDKSLVTYFRSKLSADELVVNRKEGTGKTTVALGDLSTETKLHRTDVTQLYNAIFKKYNMQTPEDGRVIKADADLIKLLTAEPVKPELAQDVAAIKAGTFKLTIFNIQRFTNPHLSKAVEPVTPTA
jgi:hypothetical protein